MYYIGYTSVLSGGEDPRLFEYAQYNYEAEDDEEDTVEYDLAYFFGEGQEEDGPFIIEAPEEQTSRQLYAAYPPADVIDRSSIMIYFDDAQNAQINQMWINVRCFDIRKAPVWSWILIVGAAIVLGGWLIRRYRLKKADR